MRGTVEASVHSLLLFSDRATTPGPAQSYIDTTSDADLIAQPALAPASPFAFDAGAWRRLSLMASEGLRLAAPVAEITAVTAFPDRVLHDAWGDFAGAAKSLDLRARQGVQTLAEDIVSYARDVAPDFYRRLGALLGLLRVRPPSHEEAKACAAILDLLRQAADERARRATALSAAVGPLAEAAGRLGDTFARRERNPAVRVTLPHVPGLCLSYDDEGMACASEIKQADQRQYWVLEPNGDAYLLVSAADPGRVLVVDQDESLIPMTRRPPPFTFVDEGPRPRVERRDRARGDAARFNVSVSSDLYIQNVSYQTLALDCLGDAGWRSGAPVGTHLKRGGSSQRWAFDPPLRSRQELVFHDIIAPVAKLGRQLHGLRRVQGDWAALASDLRAGADEIQSCAEQGRPFVSSYSVVDALNGWRRVATGAREATAGLAV
jgi:hypothetical protein